MSLDPITNMDWNNLINWIQDNDDDPSCKMRDLANELRAKHEAAVAKMGDIEGLDMLADEIESSVHQVIYEFKSKLKE